MWIPVRDVSVISQYLSSLPKLPERYDVMTSPEKAHVDMVELQKNICEHVDDVFWDNICIWNCGTSVERPVLRYVAVISSNLCIRTEISPPIVKFTEYRSTGTALISA